MYNISAVFKKISFCVRVLETGTKARFIEPFPSFALYTHKLNI